eukprot:g26860.t1
MCLDEELVAEGEDVLVKDEADELRDLVIAIGDAKILQFLVLGVHAGGVVPLPHLFGSVSNLMPVSICSIFLEILSTLSQQLVVSM